MKVQKVVDLTSVQIEDGKASCLYMVRYKKHWWNEWKYIHSNPYSKYYSEEDADAIVKFLKKILK